MGPACVTRALTFSPCFCKVLPPVIGHRGDLMGSSTFNREGISRTHRMVPTAIKVTDRCRCVTTGGWRSRVLIALSPRVALLRFSVRLPFSFRSRVSTHQVKFPYSDPSPLIAVSPSLSELFEDRHTQLCHFALDLGTARTPGVLVVFILRLSLQLMSHPGSWFLLDSRALFCTCAYS